MAESVEVGQVYADARSAGRTMRVVRIITPDDHSHTYAVCEILTNDLITQGRIDSHLPIAYTPKDRRGKTTTIRVSRLLKDSNSRRGYRLITS